MVTRGIASCRWPYFCHESSLVGSRRPYGAAIAMFDVSPSISLGIRMVSGT